MGKGYVHSYESFGAADGPGVRFVVFLHGCGFRCLYCHNPDTWAGTISNEVTPEEVLARALRYRSYWGKEGGITVSGGEPMLQASFTAELFELAHAHGINTCLDTAAGPFDAASPEIQRLLTASDTVLLDIKHLDNVVHKVLTGQDNGSVLACARYLAEKGKPTWIRHVLVPGVTDSGDHLKRLGAFIQTLPNVTRVDVLPYHTMGVTKWKKLGLVYGLEGVEPPNSVALERARAFLKGSTRGEV